MVLVFGLVITRMLEIPEAVMPHCGFRTNIKASQLPPAHVLENGSECVRPFAAHEILDYQRVFAYRKARNIEFSAVGRHSIGSEDAAVEASVGTWSRASIQQKTGAQLRTRPAKGRLVVTDGTCDSIEIRLQRRNSVAAEGVHVAPAGLVKDLLRRAFDCSFHLLWNL